jgi:hypothetical protein
MKIDEIFLTIEERIADLSKEKLVTFWNSVFPEEKISVSDVSSKNPLKEEELKEEVRSMLIDEVSSFNTKTLIKTYNKLTEENLTLDDLEYDEMKEEEEDIDEEM